MLSRDTIKKIAERLELLWRNPQDITPNEMTLEYSKDLNSLKMLTKQLELFHKPAKARQIASTSLIKHIINDVIAQSRPAPESNMASLPHSPQSSDKSTP